MDRLSSIKWGLRYKLMILGVVKLGTAYSGAELNLQIAHRFLGYNTQELDARSERFRLLQHHTKSLDPRPRQH